MTAHHSKAHNAYYAKLHSSIPPHGILRHTRYNTLHYSTPRPTKPHFIVSQHTRKHRCTTTCRTTLKQTTQHYTTPDFITLRHTKPYHAIPCYTKADYNTLHYITLYCTTLYDTIPDQTTLRYTKPYHSIPCYIRPDYTRPDYTTLYQTIPLYTMLY